MYNNKYMKEIKAQENEIQINEKELNIANIYLETHCLIKTAEKLDLPVHSVESVLNTPLVKRYIDSIFSEFGYLNRFKIAGAMNDIIDKKLLEMQEAESGSQKDIAELLMLMHKINMDYAKINTDQPGIQKNVQINNYGENYNALAKALL